MTKPLLLDLFCGAGGCSEGYHRAGFEVHGCDVVPQKRYPFPFRQMDWRACLASYGHRYDAFHASPECQGYCALSHMVTKQYNMEIAEVRTALQATGKPYVIENVERAKKHMMAPLLLCGSMFGLQTSCGAQLRRHRLFESNYLLMSPGACRHGDIVIGVYGEHAYDPANYRREERLILPNARRQTARTICIVGQTAEHPQYAQHGRTIMVIGGRPKDPAAEHRKRRTVTVTGSTPQQNTVRNTERETFPVAEARIAMGIAWMSMKELSQAIPPAYCEYVGKQLMEVLAK